MKAIHKLTAAVAISVCAAAAVATPKLLAGSAEASTVTSASGRNLSRGGETATHDVARKDNATSKDFDRLASYRGVAEASEKVSAKKVGATRNIGIPASIDLRSYSMPIGYQGQVSSCVAWSVDYAMLGWYANKSGKSGAPFAPMYVYSQINHGQDKGSQPADALAVLYGQGSDTKAHYSHGDMDWSDQPNASERANAANFKISGYHTVFSGSTGQGQAGANALANELAAGHPVAIAMNVRNGFAHLQGTAVDNDTTSYVTGAHEILAVGYDSNGVLIQNSWGTNWGDHGFGRLSWNVVGKDVYMAHVMNGFAATTNTNTNNTNNNTNTTTTKPTMGAVNVAVSSGYHVNSTVPVSVKWTASSTSGISRYVIWTSTNGGQWVDTTSRMTSANATSAVLGLTPGNTYRFGVAAFDAAGNRSDYAYSATISPKVFDDNNVTTTGFSRYNWSSAYGGSALTTNTAGATASFQVTGRGVALVAPKFSTGGQMNMYVDGQFAQTISLQNSTLDPMSTVGGWFWTASGTHTITLKAVGNGRVDIDAIAIVA
jgi:C1A family cysteine protease